MSENPRLGAKIRSLRRRANLTQVKLAEQLGISPSYLNLIEHGRRPLSARVLLRAARLFELELEAFASEDDAQTVGDLREAFGDPLFEEHTVMLSEVRELAATSPVIAGAVIELYRAYRQMREAVETLRSRLSDDDGEEDDLGHLRLPSEEVNDLVQRQGNHFPAVEEAAEALWREAGLDPADPYRGLVAHLRQAHRVEVQVVPLAQSGGALRRYDPGRRVVFLAETLAPRSRNFQLAQQIGLLSRGPELDRMVSDEPRLSSDEARSLARVVLANYFAGAVLMPYERFLAACRAERYDIEVLGHRFRTSFEQVCHRLTTLRRPGAEGVPFHMLRVDIAGNISKRFSASGIRFARFSGACPRWNVHTAFLTPGMIRVQLSRTEDGVAYFCLARTVRKDRGSYHAPQTLHAIGLGCRLEHAAELVYADGIDLKSEDTIVPVGITCRLCQRVDCQQRAFPPLQQRLRVDPNVRGVSFYTPPTAEVG